MNCDIRPMTAEDFDDVLALWSAAEGVGLSDADARESIERYLERNPGLSLLAWLDDSLAGAVLCGHDGRRGYIHHLAVRPPYRRRGIGRLLVQECLAGLRREKIQKCHLFVFTRNASAIAFWQAIGFTGRSELSMMSALTDSG